MENEELPSESTSVPIFRHKVNKNTTSTNVRNANSQSSAFRSTISKKKKTQSTSKTKRIITVVDHYTSTDVDDDNDAHSTPIRVQPNLIHLSDSLASDETENDETNPRSSTMKKTTNKTIEDVWKYFTKQSNGKITCNLCPTSSSKSFSTVNELSDSNLRSHLGRIHKLTDFLYPSQRPQEKLPKPVNLTQQRKKILDEAAIQAIIDDSHSFNIFRKSGMQKFLSLAVPNYRGPNRRTVVKRLKSMYKARRSTICNDLALISDISLSADIWKSIRHDHFICLSAHYYDNHYHLNSRVIAFRHFIGPHYSDRIEKFITNEVEKLNLENKIRSLTTDNGSDIRLASMNKLKFGTRISCLIHVLNLVVQNGLWLFKIPKRRNQALFSTTTMLKKSNTKSISKSSSKTTNKSNSKSSSNKTESNPKKSSMSTTNKSNVLTSTFNDSSTDDDDNDFLTDSDISDQASEQNETDSLIDDDASSNSSNDTPSTTSSFISDAQSNCSSLENIVELEDSNAQLGLSINEEEYLISQAFTEPSIILLRIHIILKRIRKIALENVLEPFNHSTKILSTRHRPTLSICQSVIDALTNFLTVADDTPLTLQDLLKKQLLLNLNFYFDKHVNDEQQKAMLISSFLDPITYRYLNCDDKKETEIIICNEAKQHYINLSIQSTSSHSKSSTIKSSTNDQQCNQEATLKIFFQTCGIVVEETPSGFKPSTIKQKIAHYMATNNFYATFSQYWSSNKDHLPILSSFVRHYNIMCATSIDCESAFSIAGFIHRKNRSSLAPSTLRYSMILRDQNKHN
ncbi:unnamed protein product [Rotaria magnacalcarata]|uniref:BED-type domain-containing protein n=1 Tax=Rotaria magnacalcarata TaxID=392030 RepID=A0A819TYK9_9BILA|nr:unnamed protein product [Rotaria magnacalcarata]